MDALMPPNAAPVSERPAGSMVPALAGSAEIVTRSRLPRTVLGDRRGAFQVDVRSESEGVRPSLVTRRKGWLRRRRNRMLMVLAVALAIFPPMWAVYLIGWLVWRSRPQQQSMRRVRKALKALERDQAGFALKQLQEAHFLDPSNTDALYWMGLLLSRQRRQEEAAEVLSLVAERVPCLPEVEASLVDAYVAIDQPESAVYHAQRLFDAAPFAPSTLLKLADAFEAAGRLDLAIQSLEHAPLHKRMLTDALMPIHYRLGALYERQGDSARALHHFKRVYARDITYHDVSMRVRALEAGQAE
jgi:tetratricopeptide (TPR) repeat protein